MSKLRIVHLLEGLNIGGVERLIQTLAVGLNPLKYEIEVWALVEGGNAVDQFRQKDINVKIFQFRSCYSWLEIRKFTKLLREFQPHIIHSHTYFSNTLSRLAVFLYRHPIKIIIHHHTQPVHYQLRHHMVEWLLSFCTDKVVCCSEAVRKSIHTLEKINPLKVVKVYNGTKAFISKRDSQEVKSGLNLNEENLVITAIGSLQEHKGHSDLLKAIHLLQQQEKKIKVLIVGQGPLNDRLQSLAQDLKIESIVQFLGQREDVADILSVTDILVLSSIQREGFGLSLIEAMSAGCAVVATNLGGIPEVIEDQISGLLVPPSNYFKLGQAIKDLMDDPLKRKYICANAYKRYQTHFSEQQFISQINQLYSDVVSLR